MNSVGNSTNDDFYRAINVICKQLDLKYSVNRDNEVEIVFTVVGTKRKFDTLEKAFHYLGGYQDAKQGIR